MKIITLSREELEKIEVSEDLLRLLGEEKIKTVLERWKSNPMLVPFISKVTVNIGVGEGGEKLSKAQKLLEELTGARPVPRRARRTIREFNVRRGENIGVKVTLRGSLAEAFLKKLFSAIGYRVKEESFDDHGNLSIGIREHLILPGARYDPEIGIFGMDVCITLERKGYRIARRIRARSRIPRRHRVSREEGILLLALKFNLNIIPSSRKT
ncbi:MAG: 50S ribosomal protein L5 [Sulfolobales archaeon]